MSTIAAAISVDEYLSTAYEPDMEFVDGLLVERNLGAQRHSLLQGLVIFFFRAVPEIPRDQGVHGRAASGRRPPYSHS